MNKKPGGSKIGKQQDWFETEPDEVNTGFGMSEFLKTQQSAREFNCESPFTDEGGLPTSSSQAWLPEGLLEDSPQPRK